MNEKPEARPGAVPDRAAVLDSLRDEDRAVQTTEWQPVRRRELRHHELLERVDRLLEADGLVGQVVCPARQIIAYVVAPGEVAPVARPAVSSLPEAEDVGGGPVHRAASVPAMSCSFTRR